MFRQLFAGPPTHEFEQSRLAPTGRRKTAAIRRLFYVALTRLKGGRRKVSSEVTDEWQGEIIFSHAGNSTSGSARRASRFIRELGDAKPTPVLNPDP